MEQLGDYIDMVIGERIKMLLFRKQTEKEDAVMNEGEQVIQELDGERKAALESYMDLMTDRQAEDEVKAYIGGLKDGICLVTLINRICEGYERCFPQCE